MIGFFLFPCLAFAAVPFYEGETVRIIVGYSPGGGYDAYSRLIARHLGKHIPGNPPVIADNMPWAGSLIAANHLFRVAKPEGTADIRLAAESGELAGSAWWWESIKATWRKGLEAGEVFPVLQVVPKPLPDLPKVPLAISPAKTEEGRQLIEVGIHGGSVIARPYVLPPGTPRDRVEIVRKPFQETFKDKECIARVKSPTALYSCNCPCSPPHPNLPAHGGRS
jgi:hypothetical protein